jgi:hypothetical protein
MTLNPKLQVIESEKIRDAHRIVELCRRGEAATRGAEAANCTAASIAVTLRGSKSCAPVTRRLGLERRASELRRWGYGSPHPPPPLDENDDPTHSTDDNRTPPRRGRSMIVDERNVGGGHDNAPAGSTDRNPTTPRIATLIMRNARICSATAIPSSNFTPNDSPHR